MTDLRKHQLKHKRIPKEIKFYDENGQEVKYFIDHDDSEIGTSNDFFPIIAHQNNSTTKLMFEGPSQIPHEQRLVKDSICSITDINTCFQQGKEINQQRKLSLSSNSDSDSDVSHTYSEVAWPLNDNLGNEFEFDDSDEDTDGFVFACVSAHTPRLNKDFENEVNTCRQTLENSGDTITSFIECNPPAENSSTCLSQFENPNIEIIKDSQMKDSVLSEVIKWVQEGSKPERSMAIRHSKALTAYYRLFDSLQIDPKSNLLVYSESNPNVPACIDSFDSKICLPLKLLYTVLTWRITIQ